MSKAYIIPLVVLSVCLHLIGYAPYPAVAQNGGNVQVYFVDFDGGTLQRSDLAIPGLTTTLTTGLQEPIDLAIDATHGFVYIAVAEGIERVTLDGTDQTTIISDLSRPWAIKLDVAHGHVYWTDKDRGTINRSNLDGSDVVELRGELEEPSGIALDLTAGKMYFTEYGRGGFIHRANLDGSVLETFTHIAEVEHPNEIELDIEAGKMYWVEYISVGFIGSYLYRAELNGTNVELILDSYLNAAPAVWGLGLDPVNQKIVFSTWRHSHTISRSNFDGSEVEELVVDLINPTGVAVLTHAPRPIISVEPQGVDFGLNIPVHTFSDLRIITITNAGTADLEVSSLYFSGTAPAQCGIVNDTCSNHSLPPTAQCMLRSIFAPTVTGMQTGLLAIPSNDPDTPTVTVELTGESVEAIAE